MTLSGPTNPKPKHKQIRPTASAIQQQWCINNLKVKRHKSDVHKAAVRLYSPEKQSLYSPEKQKPTGMSIRQV